MGCNPCDTPSAPAAPDPAATAAAQTGSNVQTAIANATLNRVNQVTPWGSQTYTQAPDTRTFDQKGYDAAMQSWQNSPTYMARPDKESFYSGGPTDGVRQWTSTVTLSPEQQKLLDSSNRISQSYADLGESQLGNVTNTLKNPLDFSSLQQVQNNPLASSVNYNNLRSNYGNGGDIQYQYGNGGDIKNSYANGGDIARNIQGYGSIQNDVDTGNLTPLQTHVDYGKIQDNLDTSKVPGMVGGDALAGTMGWASDAAYRQSQSRLDPQWNQQQHDLQNQLTQQGIMQNSDAWNRAMQDFSRSRNDAYQTAMNNSVTQGLAAQGQLYNQGLSSNQNAFNQALSSGNFSNAAQAQGFGQALSNANLNNAANAQQFGQNSTAMQLRNAAQAQGFGQNAQQSAFQNAAQQQANTQNSNAAAFQNAAQQQQNAQNLQAANYWNAAQQQQNTQNQNAAAFGNQAELAQYGMGANNAQLQNAAANQAYNQSLGLRNQGINELLTQQQNPLNVMNALRTGSQLTAPQFGNTPQSNISPTDIASIINQNYANQMGAYNGQVSQQNAMTSGLFNLGGMAMLKYSDRRLKTDIQRIGTHPLGIGIYSYKYIWGDHDIGVMADEVQKVKPDAVHIHKSGYAMVDYGRLQ